MTEVDNVPVDPPNLSGLSISITIDGKRWTYSARLDSRLFTNAFDWRDPQIDRLAGTEMVLDPEPEALSSTDITRRIRWSAKRLRSTEADLRKRLAETEYLETLPQAVPSDKLLVHNTIRPIPEELGTHGFRAWLSPQHPRLESCDCGFAKELGQHYRVQPFATDGQEL